jgi:hypothetical protein
MLPNAKFNILDGGLGKVAPNKDGVTGIAFFNTNIADLTTFSATNRIVKFTSLKQVEATGITATSTNFKAEWYQISEFYRYGGIDLWIGIFATTSDETVLNDMNLKSNGEVRLYGYYRPAVALTTGVVGEVNVVLDGFVDIKKPAICVAGFDTSALTLATLPDLRALTSKYVSVVIGQDFENYPSTVTVPVPNVGVILGALAASKVSTNVLYVAQYNYSNDVQMVKPALYITEATVSDCYVINTFDDAALDALNDKGYIFWRYLANVNGTYLSNDNNCNVLTSDYSNIHNVRTINKAIREVDAKVSLLLGSPVILEDGVISSGSLAVFNSNVSAPLNNMLNNSEISNFRIFIDPTQNIASTGIIEIQIAIVPVLSADWITVSIGYSAI